MEANVATRPMDWHPAAAYLYVLGLDDLSLAWEYLRRNPQYRRDWARYRRRGRTRAAAPWGLSFP